MKNLAITFGFLSILAFSLVPTAEAVTIWGRGGSVSYSRSGSTYWNYVQNYYAQKNETQSTSTINRSYSRPSYTRKRTPSTYQRQLTPNYATSSTQRTYTPTYTRRSTYTPRSSTSSSYTPTYGRIANTYTRTGVRVSVNALSQRQPKQSIDNGTIDVFNVGIVNGGTSGSNFSEAQTLDSMTFQMYGRSGIANDPEDFELVVNDQAYNFQSNGSISIRFTNGNRIASGENLNFTVKVRIDSPENVSNQPGAFRLRLVKATTRGELSGNIQNAFISGQAFSDVIAYDPVTNGGASGSGIFTTIPSLSLFSSNLQAGQAATVMALNLGAAKDDLLIQKLTVRDTLTPSGTDNLINTIQAIDGSTGEILGTTRFVNGKANFNFGAGIYIRRNDQRSVVFVINIESNIPTSGNTSFKLDILPTDLEVISNSTGKQVAVSNTNINVTNNTYTVVGSNMSVRASNQPSTLVVTGQPNQIYRFQINNPSSKTISLGRVSFSVFLGGVEFPGGISTDDFDLKILKSSGSEISTDVFTPISASGNTVTFDTLSSEFSISGGQTIEFGLKAALQNIGSSNGDSVSVKILGDSSVSRGTLTSVKGGGNSFIWSDHSGRPHTASSNDWMNGYLVDGLPTPTTVITR